MHTQEPIKAFDHIAQERLEELATVDAAILTITEYRHLQACYTCFTLWWQFIEEGKPEGPSGRIVGF